MRTNFWERLRYIFEGKEYGIVLDEPEGILDWSVLMLDSNGSSGFSTELSTGQLNKNYLSKFIV